MSSISNPKLDSSLFRKILQIKRRKNAFDVLGFRDFIFTYLSDNGRNQLTYQQQLQLTKKLEMLIFMTTDDDDLTGIDFSATSGSKSHQNEALDDDGEEENIPMLSQQEFAEHFCDSIGSRFPMLPEDIQRILATDICNELNLNDNIRKDFGLPENRRKRRKRIIYY